MSTYQNENENFYLSSRKLKRPDSSMTGSYTSLNSQLPPGQTAYDARDTLRSKRRFREIDNQDYSYDADMFESDRLRLMKAEKSFYQMESDMYEQEAARYGYGKMQMAHAEHGSEGSGLSPRLGLPNVGGRAKQSSIDYMSELESYEERARVEFHQPSNQPHGNQSYMSLGKDLDDLAVEEYVEYKVKAGTTNMEYKTLFAEFMYPQMNFVYIYDSNFLFPYHTDNLARFVGLLKDKTNVKRVILETSPRAATRSQMTLDLEGLQRGLKEVGINFEFFFVKLDLDRKPWIRFGRQWKVSLDRGLDIFVSPESALDKLNMVLRRTHSFNLFAVKYDIGY